jgi:hypothetical protein
MLDKEKLKREMEEILEAFEEFHKAMLQRVVTETPKEPTKTEEVKKGSEGPLDNKPSSNNMKEGDDENQNEI